jgi:protein-S-isoprenylcysteine O-methyltransferase Ste14
LSSQGSPSGSLDSANLGLARPPFVYLVAIALGLILHGIWPLGLAVPLATPVGVLLMVLAAALLVYALGTFRAAGTPVPGNRPTTTIVRAGPYRFTRNPIYAAFSLFQLGAAVWVGSAWLIATLVAAVALMSRVVIPREERYLERRFGSDYLDYKASVRRWL